MPDADRCELRTNDADTELVGIGHVRANHGDVLVLDVGLEPGKQPRPGDSAIVDLFNPMAGRTRCAGVISIVDGTFVEVVQVTQLARLQERDAVRVSVHFTHRLVAVIGPDGDHPLVPHVDVQVLDVSATGLRFRHRHGFDAGTRLRSGAVTGLPFAPVLEVVRQVPATGGVDHGCRFVDVSARDTDVLFAFVTDQQRQQLRARRRAS